MMPANRVRLAPAITLTRSVTPPGESVKSEERVSLLIAIIESFT